ncbi:centrosomal protein 43-like [Phymastichus coffea]|uniref:centrosomal protein 43-like n=1 Tax=Phymastichus coffea TaxID=108790 RepID=UPI00273AC7A1|nr:centrosomal protein 43-like [Phymastichus coffea]
MIDGNISMEEDTELRDLVVQTLENNGILAKVRAELRASVFLTLEEQESVLNPEQFLNKTVKQYLASFEGKLLFSLVREFLEYFGLDYTISVYDPETYFGKEYNYAGRKKLSEALGINTKEPLLGELLKNTINGALINILKNDSSSIRLDKTNDTSDNIANATFNVSVPKVLQKDSETNSAELSETIENESNSSSHVPTNVTVTKSQEIQNDLSLNNERINSIVNESSKSETDKDDVSSQIVQENSSSSEKSINDTNRIDLSPKLEKVITVKPDSFLYTESKKNRKNLTGVQNVNEKNIKQTQLLNNSEKTVYFDEIVVGGIKDKITETKKNDLLLGNLPPILSTNNSVLSDLPPLSDKKANMNDLKQLMDIAQGVSQYEDDFPSSTSGSASEQSPSKVQKITESFIQDKNKNDYETENTHTENESEEIDEEIST